MSLISPDIPLKKLNAMGNGNMVAHLGIEFTEVHPDGLSARMPVDHRTQQPMGLLHGGASVVLAETIGSVASHLCVDTEQYYCVGLDINANHIRAVTNGYVLGTAKALHVGRRTHVWEIRIVNEKQQLVCISRLTMAVVEK
ncbi:MAG: hotdog fold thioesterase [Cyclobacteriaceae bacterium]